MKVKFQTTWLAPGGTQAASRVHVNGRQLVDDAEFFRAVAATFYPRGNLRTDMSFTTHWIFNTVKDAEVFVLTHARNIPMGPTDTGVLICTCGDGSDTQLVYMNGAVIESAEISGYVGESVAVTYTIHGPYFQTDVPPDVPSCTDPAQEVLVFRRDSVPISNGATSVAVVFSSPFGGTPIVTPTVTGVSGSQALFGRLLKDTVSTTGFTVELSAAAPDGTSYTLDYWAVQ